MIIPTCQNPLRKNSPPLFTIYLFNLFSEARGAKNQKWINTWRVNQICNESSKTANPLYTKLSPSLPDSFSAKAISKNIIATYQVLIFTDSKINYQMPLCGILVAEIAKHVGPAGALMGLKAELKCFLFNFRL